MADANNFIVAFQSSGSPTIYRFNGATGATLVNDGNYDSYLVKFGLVYDEIGLSNGSNDGFMKTIATDANIPITISGNLQNQSGAITTTTINGYSMKNFIWSSPLNRWLVQ